MAKQKPHVRPKRGNRCFACPAFGAKKTVYGWLCEAHYTEIRVMIRRNEDERLKNQKRPDPEPAALRYRVMEESR